MRTIVESLARLVWGAGFATLVAWPLSAVGQVPWSSGVDQSPTRVLQVEQTMGPVHLERHGRATELKPGFLVLSDDRVTLPPRSRVDLQLSRYGEIDLVGTELSPAAMSFERLPFSTWAVDLETRMRLESGVMRLHWRRAADAADWPFGVLLGPWALSLGNGEFLFRRDERGTLACNVSGSIELSDEASEQSKAIAPGHCQSLSPDGAQEVYALRAGDWSELQVAFLPMELDEQKASVPSQPQPPAPPAPESAAAPVLAPQGAGPDDLATTSEPSPAMPQAPAPASAAGIVPPVVLEPSPELAASIPAAPSIPVPPATEPAPAATPAPESTPPPVAAAAPPVSQRPLADAVLPPPPPGTPPGTSVGGTPPPASLPMDAAPPSLTGPEWIVNVTSVTDPAAARRHLEALNEAGYPATMRTEMVRGRASYRVIISGISNEQGARRTAQLLSSKMGYTTAWPLQKR